MIKSFPFYFAILFSFCVLCGIPWQMEAKEWKDPRYKHRQYRTLLLDNELKILLISDPTIHRAAAAASVGVGYLNDPQTRPGLAHFLEHMLFLGTQKYPDVDNFDRFLTLHDGESNAYTLDDQTNYHFQVSSDHLEGALDRFAQFFITPLFTPDLVTREIEAINSEFLDEANNDGTRIFHLESRHYQQDHPAGKFSTGNLHTLQTITSEEMQNFYRSKYSSNQMNLVVMGKENLNTLQHWIVPRFSKIKNRKIRPNKFPQQLLKRSKNLRLLQIKTLNNSQILRLFFPLPPIELYYREKPLNLLSFFVEHEGKGSLLSLLKKENLATMLYANTEVSTNSYSGFTIHIELTPKGLQEYQKIITQTFQYLKTIQETGLSRGHFNDIKQTYELEYRFKEKSEGIEEVSNLASLLFHYPLNQVVTLPDLVTTYEPQLFNQFLAQIVPDNMQVTLGANHIQTEQKEKIYQIDYSYSENNSEAIKLWKQVSKHPLLQLPQKNPFFPQRFGILPISSPFKLSYHSLVGLKQENISKATINRWSNFKGKIWDSQNAVQKDLSINGEFQKELFFKHAQAIPRLLLDTNKGKIWFQRDFRFSTPKATLSFLIHTPEASRSPKNQVLNQLYVTAIEEGLNELKYQLQIAGLEFQLGSSLDGVTVNIKGFSDHILDLQTMIFKDLKTITIDEKTFEDLKNRRLQYFQNFQFWPPYNQALYFNQFILTKPGFSREEYIKAISSSSFQDLKNYSKTLFNNVYLEGVVYGNLDFTHVQNRTHQILSTFAGLPLKKSQRVLKQVIQLPRNSSYEYVHPIENNGSALLLNLQIAPTNPDLEGILRILAAAIETPFYTELRTQQQVGYNVWSGWSNLENTLNLWFLVQSEKYSPDQLLDRIDQFIDLQMGIIKSLPANKLEMLKQSIIHKSLQKAETFSEQTQGLFNTAFNKRRNFDFISEDIQAIEKVSSQKIEDFINKYLISGKQKRLVTKITGKQQQTKKTAGKQIPLISKFKKSFPCPQNCYPPSRFSE